MAKTFGSVEAFEAEKRGTPMSSEPDPLAKFYDVLGLWLTGQVIEQEAHDRKPLPFIVRIDSGPETRAAARKGWTPVRFASEKVRGMLRDVYGDELPEALEKELTIDMKPRATAPPPAPAGPAAPPSSPTPLKR